MGRKNGISDEQRSCWAFSAVRRQHSMVSLFREAGETEQTCIAGATCLSRATATV